MKKNNMLNFITLLLITGLTLMLGCFSPATAKEIEESNKITGVKESLKTLELLPIPASINGIEQKSLKGYENITGKITRFHQMRAEIISKLLIHDEILEKIKQINTYNNDTDKKVNMEKIFKKGFTPLNMTQLIEKSPYNFLNDGEKQEALKAGTDLMKILDIETFEKNIQEQKEESPKTLRIFYENALKKCEIQIETSGKDLTEYLNETNKEIKSLYHDNIKIEFKIDNKEKPEGIRRNFKENESFFVEIDYSTEGIENDIPAKWHIQTPDGKIKKGEFTLSKDKQKENLKVVKGEIPQKAAAGKYNINVTLFPEQPEEIKFNEYFMAGGIPLKIKSVFILGEDKKPHSIYNQGDTLLLVLRYQPFSQTIDKAKFTWKVFTSEGKLIDSLSTSKILRIRVNEKKTQTKYIKATIPTKAPAGIYKYQAVIESGDFEEFSDIVKFQVK